MEKEIAISNVVVSDIKFDKTNPNELSNEQEKALELTMEKFGFLAPVILNKKLSVIDGEHRVKVYKKLGKKKIPAYIIDVDKIDLKILRQLMNKLRGDHNKEKDHDEYKLIFEANKMDVFSELLGKPLEKFESILNNSIEEVPEANSKISVSDEIFHRCIVGDCEHGQKENRL